MLLTLLIFLAGVPLSLLAQESAATPAGGMFEASEAKAPDPAAEVQTIPEGLSIIQPQMLKITPTLTVSDLRRATAFYVTQLGFAVALTGANYVAVARDGIQIGLAVDKSRTPASRVSCYINVSGVDALREEFRQRSVKVAKELATQPSKMREFGVLDPDNNSLIFGEYTGN